MKVLIAAGGTGGHIYPGIAVANELMARDAGTEILFIGTSRGLETRIVPDNGYQLSLINSAGLKKVGFVGKLKGLMILPKSFLESRQIIKEFSPDVVVGAGGYVSGPVVLTAHFMGFPTVVMDSNAVPGYANRRLARFVDGAAMTYAEALPYFGTRGVVTGNPVRKEFFDVPARTPKPPMQVLITGGSQGARAINNAVAAALPLLKESGLDIHLTHQTGQADFETVRKAYADNEIEADIRPFISNMVEEFDKADLIICRAGAATIAEVGAAGKAALMIPLPGASDDHQRKNAEALERKGAVRMILQSELTPERLADELSQLLSDPSALNAMGVAGRALARPDAAAATADMIEGLCRK
jgi:UDP-N-acetylglucosamine--N-acetylmuramyl-(pentapeptide) pyrophosphoryl-undecaprenol N-acetylglucosamine transferase